MRHQPRIFSYDILGQMYAEYKPVADIAGEVKDKTLPEKFRYGIYDPSEAEALVACAYVAGNCWLVLEEISTLFNVGGKIDGPYRDAVLIGRHQRVSIMAIAQRAVNIPITLRSQASRFISFRQQESADIDTLSDIIGKENAQRCKSFPDLHCMDWEKGVTTEYKIPYFGPNIP